MRGFFNAIAIAAAIAAAAPASAQGISASPDAATSGPQGRVEPAPGSERAAGLGGMRRHRRHTEQMRRYHHGWRSSADHMANRL